MDKLTFRKAILPTLFSSAVMLGLFYTWHGVVLRDLERIALPIEYFFLLASLLYIIIGSSFTIVIHYLKVKENLFKKGLIIGGIVGFVIYLAVFVLGVSFSYGKPMHIAVDFIWQMIEQSIGASIAGFIYQMENERQKFMRNSNAI